MAQEYDQWVIDVKNDLNAGCLDGVDDGPVRMPPIFRVPVKVREMNEKAYQPEVVSIGPYHHGEERLQAVEKHKRRALLHFLSRWKQTPEACLDLLRGNLPEIMADYHNLDEKWRNDQELFLKVMLMDGCFILEILLTSAGVVKDYDEDDRIFGRHGRLYNVTSIRRDLLLIENQIPLLVLRKLFVFSGAKIKAKGHGDVDDLLRLLLEFFLECGVDILSGFHLEESSHILDLYRRRFIFGDENREVFAREGRGDYNLKKFSAVIPSAMVLQDHGIVLRKGRLKLIWFCRVHVLWKLFRPRWMLDLPGLKVDDTTESVFLNAMVFESLQRTAANARFTSYVSLMSNLMVSPKDANLLSTELGIIRNGLIGRDQALVDLFGRLSSANFLPEGGLFRLQMEINEYCGRRWNRCRAYVNRTYFRNPWAQISVFSAIVLFVLTAVQTFYAIYPNYANKHNPQ